ncbi:MAG: VCBS repeat-containing protein, partial [Planctomycetaceae bacterium]|nr:VCBS repeat-containing protein [Planctomycetaceae bacterium]
MNRQLRIGIGIAILLVGMFVGNRWTCYIASIRTDQIPNATEATGFTKDAAPPVQSDRTILPADSGDAILFRDRTAESGIDFGFCGSPTANAFMTEQNGGGVAVFDLDNDDRPDVFIVNNAGHGHVSDRRPCTNAAYRGKGDFQLTDCSLPAGLAAACFGMGCATGDIDNDGFQDLFVACYGQDRLWRNNGDGTFTEITRDAGITDDSWGTSAAFCDLDGDGNSDLYVVNYVEWTPDVPPCHPPDHPEINSICSPAERPAVPDTLYQNNGDGTFRDVSATAGIQNVADGRGLAIGMADLNLNGRPDIYIANDTSPNSLFRNDGDLKFTDAGVSSGTAISSDGRIGAGMGVAMADFDRNGLGDIAVTNFRNQINDLFLNVGQYNFLPGNSAMGLDAVSRMPLSFGIAAADFNLDGYCDLFVANGHIWNWESIGSEFQYHMTPQVLKNVRGVRFEDVSETAGDYFQHRFLARAVASGDLDNDGDTDLVITNADTPPVILENLTERRGLRITLVGRTTARDGRGV